MPRNRFERRRQIRERRKLFIVATEGKRTEQIYFNEFSGDKFRKNVQVRVLPTNKGDSAPKSVLDRVRRYIRDVGVEAGDELWVVVDVDSWGARTLDELYREGRQINCNVAVSNPCFELWLVLHQENLRTPLVAKECERELVRLLGDYDKADYDVGQLISHVHNAIRHAQRLDNDPTLPWPRTVGTRVYKLVEKLVE